MNFLREKIKKFHKDTLGGALTVVFLVLLPIFVFGIISNIEIDYLNSITEETLERALIEATKASAAMVDPKSNSQADPRIAYNKARTEFIEILHTNLGLKDQLTIVKNDVKYWLIVYNGDTKYGDFDDYRVAPYYYCTNESGTFFEEVGTVELEKAEVKMTNNGIKSVTSSEEGTIVVLEEPGVIAMAQVNINQVYQNKSNKATRWMSAKINNTQKQ